MNDSVIRVEWKNCESCLACLNEAGYSGSTLFSKLSNQDQHGRGQYINTLLDSLFDRIP